MLSRPSETVNIFAFALSVTIGFLLCMGRSVEIMICQAWFSYNHLQESDSKILNKETEHTSCGEAHDSGHNHVREHSAFGLFRSA
jgi:hypothetical protein